MTDRLSASPPLHLFHSIAEPKGPRGPHPPLPPKTQTCRPVTYNPQCTPRLRHSNAQTYATQGLSDYVLRNGHCATRNKVRLDTCRPLSVSVRPLCSSEPNAETEPCSRHPAGHRLTTTVAPHDSPVVFSLPSTTSRLSETLPPFILVNGGDKKL